MIDNKNLQELVQIFRNEGHEIRIVGGAVRDYLRGVPCKDIDLCTTATPAEMVAISEKLNLHMIPTGLQHGTVTFVMHHEPFEVTTLRVDTETDGRHATVSFTRSFEADAARRDLTINAMSMDPITGQVFDYFGGEEDLTNRQIRFVGDAVQRVEEDYLRVWRWFRFSAMMSNRQTPIEYFDIFNRISMVDDMKKISGERIWAELKKILTIRNEFNTEVFMLLNCKMFNHISTKPRMVYDPKFKNYAGRESQFKPKFNWVMSSEKVPAELKEAMIMARLAVYVPRHYADSVVERLKFSVQERKYFMHFVHLWALIDDARIHGGPDQSTMYSNVVQGMDPVLAVADAIVRSSSSEYTHFKNWLEPALDADGNFVFQPGYSYCPITGQDIIDRGVPKGPMVGIIHRLVKHIWSVETDYYSGQPEKLLDKLFKAFDPKTVYAYKIVISKWDEEVEEFEALERRHKSYDMFREINETYRNAYYHFPVQPYVDEHAIVMFKSKDEAMLAKLEFGVA